MASWAMFGVPVATGPVTMMSAAAASKGEKKAGLLDWLSDALDKPSLTETDPILQKVEGATPPSRSSAAPKKAPPSKKQGGSGGGSGGGFFGLGKK